MEETSRTTSAKKQQRSTPAIRSCRTPKNPRKRSKSRSRPAVKNTAHAKPKAKRLGALAASPKSRSTRCRIAAPDPWERCLHDINGCWRPLKQICNRPKNRRKRLIDPGHAPKNTGTPRQADDPYGTGELQLSKRIRPTHPEFQPEPQRPPPDGAYRM